MNGLGDPYLDRWRAAVMRGEASMAPDQQQLPRGVDPSMVQAAAQDFSGRDAQIASQRDYASALRGTPTAQGQSVGPSGIYVAPNWAQNLEVAANRGLGGYLSGKANRADAELDTQRGEQRAAELGVGLGQAAGEQQIDASNRAQDLAADEAAAGAAVTAKKLERKQELEDIAAENARDDAAIEREDVSDKRDRGYIGIVASDGSGSKVIRQGDVVPDGFILADDYEKPEAAAALHGFDQATADAIGNLGSPTEKKRARDNLLTFRSMGDVLGDAYAIQQQGGNWTGGKGDAMVNFAEWVVPGPFEKTARNWAKDKVFSGDELNIRGRIKNSVEQFKRSRTGANLTQMETILGEDWDPGAEGISEQAAIDRMVALQNYLNISFEGQGLPRQDVWSPDKSGLSVPTEDIVKKGTASDGRTVYKLKDGRTVDERGNEVK